MHTIAREPGFPSLGAQLATGSTRASFAVVERTLCGGHMPALHVHDEDEVFHVVEGRMTVFAGNEAVLLEPGDSYAAPRRVPHTYVANSERVRFRAMSNVRSAASYEDFLRAAGRPTADRAWATEEDASGVTAVAGAAGITVLGPPGRLP